MTEKDLAVVVRMIEDAIDDSLSMPSIDSIHLDEIYDRVDVDARKLDSAAACALVDLLSQGLGRKGYLWDVWMAMNDRMIHVAERGREAD